MILLCRSELLQNRAFKTRSADYKEILCLFKIFFVLCCLVLCMYMYIILYILLYDVYFNCFSTACYVNCYKLGFVVLERVDNKMHLLK